MISTLTTLKFSCEATKRVIKLIIIIVIIITEMPRAVPRAARVMLLLSLLKQWFPVT